MDQLDDVQRGAGGNHGDMSNIVVTAVEAAIKAALPTIVQAVRDACLASLKDIVNPSLLRTQFKQDELQHQEGKCATARPT